VGTGLVLVDGEHYPPVLRAALAQLPGGVRPVAALVLGGVEKVAGYGADLGLGLPTEWVPGAAGEPFDVLRAGERLREMLGRTGADEVIDLSDDPPLDARTRLALAAHALVAGVPYRGADFLLHPPPRPRLAQHPSIAVIGSGKRAGKTAVSGQLARGLREMGRRPLMVAMGRGGPEEPVVLAEGAALDAARLLEIADGGGHAASDCYEDAVTTGAAAVGARRAGGGLAGGVAYSNLDAALRAAASVPHDTVVLEGSGAAIPPAHADATALVVPATADPELISGYLGPYRLLLADVVVVTMSESPKPSPRQVEDLLRRIGSTSPGTVVLRTVLRPEPLGAVDGAKVFFATTAPAAAVPALSDSLQTRFACEVVGTSHRLADRSGLRRDLDAAPGFEVLLVELKAAAVDVAARTAAEVGARVVFCDNRPVAVGVEDPGGVLPAGRTATAGGAPETATAAVVEYLAGLASVRFAAS
jgi:cyclic 2,3-diphosphoglycerate synthetase